MNANVEAIRPQLIKPVKLQFPAPMAGFDQANSFGVYRHTGGKPLGVVGKDFTPANLGLFLDLIVQSIDKCADWLDLDKMKYVEYAGGSKVRISIPGPRVEITGSPRVGDVIDTRLDFGTGFDGLTKATLGVFDTVLACMNGAVRNQEVAVLSFKNTSGNQGKWMLFCDQILKVIAGNKDFEKFMSTAAKTQYTKAQRDAFFAKVTGVKEADKIATRQRNILDHINNAVAMEERELGTTFYALLNGITRYTTHNLAENVDDLLINTPAKLNKLAYQAVNQLMYAN